VAPLDCMESESDLWLPLEKTCSTRELRELARNDSEEAKLRLVTDFSGNKQHAFNTKSKKID
jgi:hypothetical protein